VNLGARPAAVASRCRQA